VGDQRAGRFDLPGALTATAGVALLVYGLSNAATTADGVSLWGDAKVVASLTAAAVLLTACAVIESRSWLASKRVQHRDSGKLEVLDVAGDHGHAVYPRRCRDERVDHRERL
jgi:hypothetical protein